MSASSILVAGVGNIFLGDDAFGVEAVRALSARPLSPGVSALDFGIRGFDLAFALLHPWSAVIIVDALSRGGSPGTLYTLQPDLAAIKPDSSSDMTLNTHGMDPLHVVRLALSMGQINARVYVLGCEPQDFGDELEGRMGLSPIVQASIPEAVTMLEALIGDLLHSANANAAQTVLTK